MKTIEKKSWIQAFTEYPLWFGLVVIAFCGVLTELPLDRVFINLTPAPNPELLKVFIEHTVTGLLLLWLLNHLGLLKKARFTSRKEWKSVWLVWPLLIMTLLNLDSLFSGMEVIDTSRPGMIVLFVGVNLAVGFLEELMARGLVLVVMLEKWGHTKGGIYKSVLVSSALFGIGHVFNILSGHLPPLSGLTQILYSFFFGVIFAACFLRNNSIYPVIITHAMIDFAGGLRHISVNGADSVPLANNNWNAIFNALIFTGWLLVYGLVILRKVTPQQAVL